MTPAILDAIRTFCDELLVHEGLLITPARQAEMLAERIALTGTGLDYARVMAHSLIGHCV